MVDDRSHRRVPPATTPCAGARSASRSSASSSRRAELSERRLRRGLGLRRPVAEVRQRRDQVGAGSLVTGRRRRRGRRTPGAAPSPCPSAPAPAARRSSFPTPWMRVSRATSPRSSATTSSSTSRPESTVIARRGPDVGHRGEEGEHRLLRRGEEAEELEGVLAHHGAHPDPDRLAGRRQPGQGEHGEGDPVAHAGHLDDGLVVGLLEHRAVQRRQSRARPDSRHRSGRSVPRLDSPGWSRRSPDG